MLFVSTRGKTDLVCSAHAITRGLADDGRSVRTAEIPGTFAGRGLCPCAV